MSMAARHNTTWSIDDLLFKITHTVLMVFKLESLKVWCFYLNINLTPDQCVIRYAQIIIIMYATPCKVATQIIRSVHVD